MRRVLGFAVVLGALVFAIPASADALTFFHSPSGNIGCVMDAASGVRCDIARHDWPTPPKPGSCDLDFGGGVHVGARRRGSFVCAGDTTLHAGPVLAFGRSSRAGRYTCRSRRTGMRCVNRRTAHGFDLSRQRYRLF